MGGGKKVLWFQYKIGRTENLGTAHLFSNLVGFLLDQLSHLAMSFAFNEKDLPPGIPEVYLPQKTHGNYFSA